MTHPDDIWNAIGELPEDEIIHVVTKLFTIYEELLKRKPEDPEALGFFRNLGNAIEQTTDCNLNRR